MSNNTVIRIDKVNKSFKLPHERQGSIKNIFIAGFNKRRTIEKQQVLNNVTFEVKKGEFFGIVGRNGSGKSTLLKLMAGIYYPDRGGIKVEGKLVPFIELGVGFNPDLTGRENVFLNGALFGFSRQEMQGMYDEIVEFAELEKFMDQKLKNYSSGMQVRLAFSIAIQAKGEVLLLDEVLAVGDAAFQRKCYEYFSKLKRTKKTVVLVTHDMSAIEKYCDRALLISKGSINTIGSPQEVAYQYNIENLDVYSQKDLESQRKIQKHNNGPVFKLVNNEGAESNIFQHGDELTVKIHWKNQDIMNVGVALLTDTGEYVFGTNTDIDDIEIDGTSIAYKLKLNLGDGKYMFKIGFYGKTDQDKLVFIDSGPSFSVVTHNKGRWGGITALKHEWKNA